jgi:hypothetical protein
MLFGSKREKHKTKKSYSIQCTQCNAIKIIFGTDTSSTFTASANALTYLLTPWSRVLLEKLTGFAASQEIPRIYRTRKFITILTSACHLSLSRESISPCQYYLTWVFTGTVVSTCPTPKPEGHPLSAVRDYLFNLSAATLHIGGRSSFRNLRTRHAVVTGTHLTWKALITVRTLHLYMVYSVFTNADLVTFAP